MPRLILGPPLVMVLVYLWSRAFPTANINFMGVVTLQVSRRLSVAVGLLGPPSRVGTRQPRACCAI